MIAALALLLAAAPGPNPEQPKLSLPPELQRASQVLNQHMKDGVPETRVGSWVMYQFTGGADRVHFMRLAVTGEEKDKLGRPAWWMELEMGTHAKMLAPMAQMKMLVAKAEGISAKGVSRMIVSWGTVRPQELDDKAIALLFQDMPKDPTDDKPNTWEEAGKASLSTRTGKPTRLVTLGGTVDAVPLEIRLRETVVKRVWLSRQVPLLQLARIEMPAIDHTMELRDYGTDARPRIIMPVAGTPLVGVTHFDDETKISAFDDPQEPPSAKGATTQGQ
jgi:hypothetical protein